MLLMSMAHLPSTPPTVLVELRLDLPWPVEQVYETHLSGFMIVRLLCYCLLLEYGLLSKQIQTLLPGKTSNATYGPC